MIYGMRCKILPQVNMQRAGMIYKKVKSAFYSGIGIQENIAYLHFTHYYIIICIIFYTTQDMHHCIHSHNYSKYFVKKVLDCKNILAYYVAMHYCTHALSTTMHYCTHALCTVVHTCMTAWYTLCMEHTLVMMTICMGIGMLIPVALLHRANQINKK